MYTLLPQTTSKMFWLGFQYQKKKSMVSKMETQITEAEAHTTSQYSSCTLL